MRLPRLPRKLYLLLIVISVFNVEVLTGSTSILQLVTLNPISWSSFPFYGLALLLYIDIADRFDFDGVEIFLLGMMHGILEEGIAVWTFFFKQPMLSSTYNLGTVSGINVNWAIVVSFGESILLVVLGILFARIVAPYHKRQRYLLSPRGVKISVGILGLMTIAYNCLGYLIFHKFPQPLAYALTWGMLVFFGLAIMGYRKFIKQWLHQRFAPNKSYGITRYFLFSFLIIVAFAISGQTTEGHAPLAEKLIVVAGVFAISGLLLCRAAWSDSTFNFKKNAVVFMTLFVLLTLTFIPSRSIESTIVMVLVVIFEIVLVVKGVKQGGIEWLCRTKNIS